MHQFRKKMITVIFKVSEKFNSWYICMVLLLIRQKNRSGHALNISCLKETCNNISFSPILTQSQITHLTAIIIIKLYGDITPLISGVTHAFRCSITGKNGERQFKPPFISLTFITAKLIRKIPANIYISTKVHSVILCAVAQG